MFHKFFYFGFGYFYFYQFLNALFVNSPSYTCCDGNERVDLPAGSCECVYEWVVFSGFFTACILREFVMAVGDSINYMVCDGVGLRGGQLSVGAPNMHSMFGLSLAKHVHGVVGHVHWSSHYRTVLSCGLEFW